MMHNEIFWRLSVFIGLFVVFVAAELLWPRIQYQQRDGLQLIKRWPANIGLGFLNALAVRLLFPLAAVGVAAWATLQQIGFFWWLQNSVHVPFYVQVLLSVVLLDLVVYWQHRLFHVVPLLWRLHRVHHTDRALDVSSALRFHTLEIVLSMLIKMVAVVLLGAPVVAVIVFEIILNALAMFNHANMRLPLKLDKILRKVIVTPDMHRTHHSVLIKESNTNFGFNLSVWDVLFKSYTAEPEKGCEKIELGIVPFEKSSETKSFLWLLMLPFRNK